MKLKYLLYSLPAFVFLIWLTYPHLLVSDAARWFIPSGDWARRGVIGDSFGALNALFSGLALAGLGINIYLQSKQLSQLEKKEKTNEAQLAMQAQAMRFTALLNYYNNEIDRLERLSDEMLNLDPDEKMKSEFWERINDLKSKREAIVSKLNLH